MKWVFLLATVGIVPLLAVLLRSSPRYLVPTAFLLGASMFIVAPGLWAAPVPWPGWPGYVHGIEVSFMDGVSLAIILATRPVHISRFVIFSFSILWLAFVISTFAGQQMMPALFYGWQLARSALLFVAVARLCASAPKAPIALIAGLGVGLIYEAGLAVQQYLGGTERPGGNLTHANFLGLASDFIVFPAVALMLGSRKSMGWAVVLLAGLVIAIVGGSRATIGLIAIGTILTVFLSLFYRRTSRKMAFAAASAVLFAAAVPAMIWAANRRSEAQLVASDAERTSMKLAARMMAMDYPLGVGANQYVVVANVQGYSQRAGVAWNPGSRAAPVHNAYYLVMAEMGYLGLLGFVGTIVSLILLGIRELRRRGIPGDSGELVPGLLATLIVVSVHISYEWVFMNFVPHYLFAISAGMLVALAARAKSAAKLTAPLQTRLATSPAL